MSPGTSLNTQQPDSHRLTACQQQWYQDISQHMKHASLHAAKMTWKLWNSEKQRTQTVRLPANSRVFISRKVRFSRHGIYCC